MSSKRTQWHRFTTATPSNPSSDIVRRSKIVHNDREGVADFAAEACFVLCGLVLEVVALLAIVEPE